ncbi:MAG: hypothetical protein Q8O19_07960 [Rectinemataceae bacterium]|nr:hypothetical protein [Rectinemataceae bacterium]
MALKHSLELLAKETLPVFLFPKPPIIRFIPGRKICHCGEGLGILKTQCKTVLSLAGPFIAHETVLDCPVCASVFGSDALLRLVPSRCNVAYDILVFVGKALFQRHRTTQEIIAELLVRNVRISASEIGYLGRRFIMYLAVGHRRARPQIRRAMSVAGGYILHLDAMHEDDAPVLMTGMDSLSEIVLANVKILSEHADYIVPFLKTLKKKYGVPRACVHDMGTGICKAVAEVFPGTRDFICHFHFLRDIGKDLLEPAYRLLRNSLRKHAASSRLSALAREVRQRLSGQISQSTLLVKEILTEATAIPKDMGLLFLTSTYSLVLWALRGKHKGCGYGFPFDRPLLEFAERLLELGRRLPKFLDLLAPKENLSQNDRKSMKTLIKLAKHASNVAKDPELNKAISELRWRAEIFDRLRLAMRIALPGGDNGLNDNGADVDMATIRQNVKRFQREIKKDGKLSADPLIRKMIKQLDKYGEKLFTEPIEVDTPNGKVTLYPQRTNNMLEQFFRGIRHSHRRKTGNNSIRRTLQAMLADTPLVKNLENPEYMKILLDGKTNLEELFADLSVKLNENDTGSEVDTDRILPGYRNLIKLPNLPKKVVGILSRVAKNVQSKIPKMAQSNCLLFP